MRMPAMVPITVVDDTRHVVINDKAGEADFLQGAHRLDHVHVAFTQKALLEDRYAALHIAEVHVEYFATLPKVFNRLDDAWSHLAETSHTKIEAMIRTWRDCFHCFFE